MALNRISGPIPFRTPWAVPVGGARGAGGSGGGAGSGGGGGGGGDGGGGGSGTSSIPVASPGATVPVGGSQAIVWLDDNMKNGQAMNGEPAIASVMKRIANLANQIAYAGKPYFNWIADFAGSTAGCDDANSNPVFRQVYLGRNYGSIAEGTYVHWAPTPSLNQQSGFQGWGAKFYDTSYSSAQNFSTAPSVSYPLNLLTDRIVSNRGFTAANSELKISSMPDQSISGGFANAPRLHSGMVLQQPQDLIDPVVTGSYVDSSGTQTGKNPYVGTSLLHVGGDVVGVTASESSSEALRRLRVNLVDTIQFRRGQIGWSAIAPGTNYVTFDTSSQDWRYIFDQTYGGGGSGNNSSLTSPAITLPLYLSAQDMATQVRVYVFVYAAMSGTANTGSIGIANRDSSGNMAVSPSAVTNPITISGTTFQWYPSVASATGASLNLATAPYFMGYAGGFYDRVVLCAKSSGATDTVRIAAFTLIPIGLAYQPTAVTSTPTPPGTPYLWYSAQDINLTSNSGIADGASIASWKNKGSAGSAGDLAQATGAAKPTFKLTASAGKIGNKSSVGFDGGDFIQVASGLTINQTDIIAIVVRTNSIAGQTVIMETNAPANCQQLSQNAGPWHMYAGTERDASLSATANTYHVLVTTWSGAASAIRANKVAGTLPGTPGAGNGTGFTLGGQSSGATFMTGEIVEVLVYTDGSATAAAIEAYFDSMYGSSWPQ